MSQPEESSSQIDPLVSKKCIDNCTIEPEQSSDNSIFSLENLPVTLLDEVFQYVQSHDLIKLACLSKSLYWPVVHRVYKTISFLELDYSTGGAIYDTRVCRDAWKLNYGTVRKVIHMKGLYEAVEKNSQLGELVQSLSYIGVSGGSSLFAGLLWYLPNLRVFHDDAGTVYPHNLYRSSKLTSVSTAPHSFIPPNSFPKLSFRLVELRLVCFDTDRNTAFHHDLATYFLESNNYQHLRKIDFSDWFLRDYQHRSLSPRPPPVSSPAWMGFVNKFVSEGVQLNLTALGLSGRLSVARAVAVPRLQRFTNLNNLKCLTLNHSEDKASVDNYFRDLLGQEDNGISLLSEITQYTPRLESLSINPVSKNTPCDIDSISDVLTDNIPHQLKEFSLDFVSSPGNELDDIILIKNSLAYLQMNLVKLRIENGSSLVAGTDNNPAEVLVNISSNLIEDWNNQAHRSDLFPRVFNSCHDRPYLSDKSVQYIRDNLSAIHDCMLEDQFYREAPGRLPHLTQYYTGRLFIDMKKRGVFVNDETLVFD